jgi:hypothetical protein
LGLSEAGEFPRRSVFRARFLIIPAGKSKARFVGHRPGTEVRWQANRHLWFQADYGIFYAGKFVKESQSGRNLNYWAYGRDTSFRGKQRPLK